MTKKNIMKTTKSTIFYKCRNCEEKWNNKVNCMCYNKANCNSKLLLESVKKRLGLDNLDYETFISNLTKKEKKERQKNNLLFSLCSHENSIKHVIVS